MDNAATRTYLLEQMGWCTTADQANALVSQGLTIQTLVDFTKEGIKAACVSARCPGGLNEEGDPNRGELIPAIVEEKLKTAAVAAKFYKSVGRAITPAAMNWNRIKAIKAYKEQVEKSVSPSPLVEFTKTTSIVNWMDTMNEVLRSTLGASGVPLSYTLHDDIAIPNADALRLNVPYGVSHASFDDELIAGTSHYFPAFVKDNATVLLMLKTGLQSTQYIQSIHPYALDRNGRSAWFSLKSQHLGTAIWDGKIARANKILETSVYDGKSPRYTLVKHFSNLRAVYMDLVRASHVEGVEVTLPTGRLRVTNGLRSIQCANVTLQAAKMNVHNHEDQRNDFEKFATYILLATFEEKGIGEHVFNISAVDQGYSSDEDQPKKKKIKRGSDDKGTARVHAGRGETNVEFRYYTYSEYKRLSAEQKLELKEWRDNNSEKDKKKPKGKGNRQISALQKENTELMQQLDKARQPAAPPGTPVTTLATVPTNRTNGALHRRTGIAAPGPDE